MGQRITSRPHESPTWWTDYAAVTHICESAAPLGNKQLTWTLCDREVETGAAFVPTEGDTMSCGKCAAADSLLKQRREAALA